MTFPRLRPSSLIPALLLVLGGCSSAAVITDTPARPSQLAAVVTAYAPDLPVNFANADLAGLLKAGTVRALTAQESIALAVALANQGKTDAAIVTANLGLGASKSDREKAALLATLALLWGSKKEFHLAAETVAQGQTYLPDDLNLAGLRLIYCELANDGVGTLAAQSHLMRLDPNFSRTPVFSLKDVGQTLKTIGEIIAAAKVAWESIPREWKDAMVEMVGKILVSKPLAR